MKTETQKATLKVEKAENVQLSAFDTAQKSIIEVGYKIKRHNKLKQDLTHLLGFEAVDKPSHSQEVKISDDNRNDFRISEPIVVKQLIDFLIGSCRNQMQQLESEIVEDSRVISQRQAA